MAPVQAPDLSATPAELAAALERLSPGVSRLLKLTAFPFPLNTDSWDGYPQSRARVLQSIRAARGNTIVITGDSHTAWANELKDEQGRVAVEFGGTSVTSPGFGDFFAAGGVPFDPALRERNPDVKWVDSTHRGFLVLTLARQQATAEFFTVSTILAKQYQTQRVAAFTVAADEGPGVGAITAVT
jgi:alkaline phosphatase D